MLTTQESKLRIPILMTKREKKKKNEGSGEDKGKRKPVGVATCLGCTIQDMMNTPESPMRPRRPRVPETELQTAFRSHHKEVTGEPQKATSPKQRILRKQQAKEESLENSHIQRGTKARESGKATALWKQWSEEPNNYPTQQHLRRLIINPKSKYKLIEKCHEI